MKRICRLLTLTLLLPFLAKAEVVDRMVAVVNKQVILQSEVDQALRIELLLSGQPAARLGEAQALPVIEQLIDQTLLRQQITDALALDPGPEEIAKSLSEARSIIPGAQIEERWQAALAEYGLTEKDVEAHIVSQLRVLRFIDLRFRAVARVDREAIDTYYKEQLLPEIRKKGAPEPALADVSGKIEKILTEQRVNELLSEWMLSLRAQARIQKLVTETELAAGAASSGKVAVEGQSRKQGAGQ
ncbi:MAG TPA: SurA N-terminal domain-containing protein [Candidatus Angelobacter sp.]|nr:SurA N-terminal domain-containing protein [Candidatus Angelobacter sp.]